MATKNKFKLPKIVMENETRRLVATDPEGSVGWHKNFAVVAWTENDVQTSIKICAEKKSVDLLGEAVWVQTDIDDAVRSLIETLVRYNLSEQQVEDVPSTPSNKKSSSTK